MAQQAARPRLPRQGHCQPPAAGRSGRAPLPISSPHGASRCLTPTLPPHRAPFKKGTAHRRSLLPLPFSCTEWVVGTSPSRPHASHPSSVTEARHLIGTLPPRWAPPSAIIPPPLCAPHFTRHLSLLQVPATVIAGHQSATAIVERRRPPLSLLPHRWSTTPVSSTASRVAWRVVLPQLCSPRQPHRPHAAGEPAPTVPPWSPGARWLPMGAPT
jgi:hypothetical protein